MGAMQFRRGFPLLSIVVVRFLCAGLAAQQPSSASSSSKSPRNPEQRAKAPHAPSTSQDSTTYRNPEFAITYRIPFGWVDRTPQMQDPDADPQKSKLLLAVFARPPDAVGDTINSAVVIAAESAASYPGLKTAADYIGPLTELTTSKGFKAAAEPSEISLGTTPLVRLDFARDLGKLTMHQSSLVLFRSKFIVSFTFIAGSTDEIDELIDQLSLSPQKSK
jgi:hypothetical protein